MSLGVAIKGAEGVVLAADCRVTLGAQMPNRPPILVHYDNATKLLNFSKPHDFVGAVTYGLGLIGQRTPHSYLPEFELILPKKRIPVGEFAKQLSDFFMKRWVESSPPPNYTGPGVTFLIGGYDEEEPYGKVFLLEIPGNPTPQPRNEGRNDFGMTWGGQIDIASRLIHGYDPSFPAALHDKLGLDHLAVDRLIEEMRSTLEFKIPYHVLPLQDCIDLATFLIRTTMTAQRLAATVRGVGGPIEVAVITRTRGLEFIQRKELHGEGDGSLLGGAS
jgi:hypothetical protein